MALTVQLTVEYDFDTVPVVFGRVHDVIKKLQAMDFDVVVEVVPVKAGKVLPVPHNDDLDLLASSSGPEDCSSTSHVYIDWPLILCQYAA
jgi:hypothetical protein